MIGCELKTIMMTNLHIAQGLSEQKIPSENANSLTTVTVIIPCFNEEKFIGPCLDSILANDYIKEKLEILIIDGMSTDRTREIIGEYIQKNSNIRIIDNKARYKAFALNLGIKNAEGDMIVIMDAHATYSTDYISQSVFYLNKYNADNVGGICNIRPRNETLMGKSIALALGHKFGSGKAQYKILKEGIVETDTVFGGCYRKNVFDRIGLFNENLLRSMDMEFNQRLRKAGGKILLVTSIKTNYFTRSDLKSFIKHNIADGQWSILPFKYSSNPIRFRHLLPFIFVTGLILGPVFSLINIYLFFFYASVLSIYLFLDLFFSFEAALKKKDLRLFLLLLIVFPCRHISYGLGTLVGFIKLLFSGKMEK